MITIQEFQSYKDGVLSRVNPDIPLSYEDQVAIGVKFKQLPRKMRNWTSLAKELKLDCSGEALRKRVEKYLKRNPGLLDSTTEGEVYLNDYVEQQKVRDWYNSFRRDIREEARVETLKEFIKEQVSKLPELPQVEPHVFSRSGKPTEAILMLADLHLGEEFENSYNKYNLDIAVERLNHLLAKTIEYCTDHKVTRLNIINMGDMISGNIHVSLRIENMEDTISQTMRAAELIADFVNQAQAAAVEVTYRSVSDNHSRINKDKNQHIEKENLNRIIDWFVQERLKGTGVMFISDNLDIGVGKFTLYNSQKVFFMHGHEDKKSSVMQDMVGLTKEFPDYILMAHYHNSAEHTFQGTKVFVSGSIIGTNPYAYSHRLFSDPEQRLLIFEGRDLINIEIKLN